MYFNRAQVWHMQNRSGSNQVFQQQVPEESSNVEMEKLSLFDKTQEVVAATHRRNTMVLHKL